MSTIRKKSLNLLREAIIVGLVVAFAFGAHKAVNIWLGKEAIKNVHLENLPYAVALKKATDEGKPVMLEFAAIWCPGCRKLDKQVFAKAEVNEKISSDYVFARLDYDDQNDRKIFEQFGIKGFPTIIVMNPDKSNARVLENTFDPDHFLKQL